MIKFNKFAFLLCGLLLTLAAFPLFAQENQPSEVKSNRKPFQDFAENVQQKLATGKVDFTKPFSIELEGILTKDGKLDPKTTKFVKSTGDAEMVDIGKNFIESVNDSGFLGYLQQIGVEKINFTFSQDENQIAAILKSEQATENRAKTTASALNTILQLAKIHFKNEEEKALLSYFYVSTNVKMFSLNFFAPRDAIHELVKKHFNVRANKSSSK